MAYEARLIRSLKRLKVAILPFGIVMVSLEKLVNMVDVTDLEKAQLPAPLNFGYSSEQPCKVMLNSSKYFYKVRFVSHNTA